MIHNFVSEFYLFESAILFTTLSPINFLSIPLSLANFFSLSLCQVGELEPDQGLIERHPNLRVAYVAQHAFAHIEDHLDMTPCEYVMWRYRGGVDKEMVKKDANTMTDEEMEALRKKAKEEKSGV